MTRRNLNFENLERHKCEETLNIDPISLFMLLFITAVPNTKLCAWGEEDSAGHVL